MPILSVPTGAPPTGVLGVLYPPGLRLQRCVFPVVVQPVGDCRLSLCIGLLHLLLGVPGLFTFSAPTLFSDCPSTFSADLWDSCSIGKCALVMAALSPRGRSQWQGGLPSLRFCAFFFSLDPDGALLVASHKDFGGYGLELVFFSGGQWIISATWNSGSLFYRGSTDFQPGVVVTEC